MWPVSLLFMEAMSSGLPHRMKTEINTLVYQQDQGKYLPFIFRLQQD